VKTERRMAAGDETQQPAVSLGQSSITSSKAGHSSQAKLGVRVGYRRHRCGGTF